MVLVYSHKRSTAHARPREQLGALCKAPDTQWHQFAEDIQLFARRPKFNSVSLLGEPKNNWAPCKAPNTHVQAVGSQKQLGALQNSQYSIARMQSCCAISVSVRGREPGPFALLGRRGENVKPRFYHIPFGRLARRPMLNGMYLLERNGRPIRRRARRPILISISAVGPGAPRRSRRPCARHGQTAARPTDWRKK